MEDIRIPQRWIEAHVESEEFEGVAPRIVFCTLTLFSGYTITAAHRFESAPHFSYTVGCRLARQAALEKLWRMKPYPDAESSRPKKV